MRRINKGLTYKSNFSLSFFTSGLSGACRKTSSSRPPIIVKEEYKFGDKYLRPFFKDRQERREREREHNEYDH